MRPVRVTLIWSEREAHSPDKMFVDFYLDETSLPHREMTFLGWLTEEKDAYPFRLTKDGRIDFGSGFEDADRWGSTNLRGKRIERGEYATVELDGEEYTYRIDKLDDLSSL